VLKYLQHTKEWVLRYTKGVQPELKGYSDSDWNNEPDSGLSRGAYIFMLAGGAISWHTKKLEGVATSATEAEYKALSTAAKEAIWYKQLFEELGFPSPSVVLAGDNTGAISLAHNPIHHGRTKHIRLAWHYLREVVASGDVVLEYIPTALQNADFLTKPLSTKAHNSNALRVGMQPFGEAA
jgi:hypothetical protein